MQYRRAKIKGGTWFFTANLADRSGSLLTDHIDLLRQVTANVQNRHPFRIDAIVILPEHLHAIWTLPPGDDDFPTRWMLIKAGFSRGLARKGLWFADRSGKGERNIWQRRYWEHLICNEDDLAKHVDYIHYNPVKHRHANRVCEWPYSSFHRYVEKGLLPLDWAGGDVAEIKAGEAF